MNKGIWTKIDAGFQYLPHTQTNEAYYDGSKKLFAQYPINDMKIKGDTSALIVLPIPLIGILA